MSRPVTYLCRANLQKWGTDMALETTQPTEPKPQASLAYEHRNDVLCTGCGMYRDPRDMVVWYTNASPRPFGPGKSNPEVHYVCSGTVSPKCLVKIMVQKGAHN